MKKLYRAIIFVVIAMVAVSFYTSTSSTNNSNSNPSLEPITDGKDQIYIQYPLGNASVTSPLKVTGKARGTWFFEASFPIFIVDWDGKIVGKGFARTNKEWMTTDFVPFEGTIEFTRPSNVVGGTYSERGTVIFKKDNPSGLPKNDAAVEVPVVFK